MAGWHDTIDLMLSLKQWWETPIGIKFGNAFVKSVEQAQPDMAGGYQTRESGWLAGVARGQIDTAEPFFVSPEVFEMVEAASKHFRPESFQATDLITRSGFVLLPRSFYVTDRHGKTNGCRAFSWGPCESKGDRTNLAVERIGGAAPAVGTYLMLYSDINDENDDDYEKLQEVREGWPATGYTLWHISPWWFGQEAPVIDDYAENEAVSAYLGARELWTWIQVFFRLSMQQIVTAQYSVPPRPYARRAKRAGRDPGVLVMSLRRRHSKHYGDDEGEGPDWQYQWLTRGHWRNQWYPSDKVHRQIWIAPYVKGPENRPFKTPDLRVWTFNR